MLKDDYLAAIRDAGFADVEVMAEATYPIGSSNPDESEIAALLAEGVSAEELRATAEAVVSVKVGAVKP
jgi:hypothetical protein